MAFTVSDFEDLMRLLREHPEWKAELRQQILDEEFLRLPEYVRQNSADIRELRDAVSANAAAIAELRATVAQNSADIRELKDAVSANTAAIAELRVTVAQNSADIRELKDAVAELRATVAQNSADIRELKDAVAELRVTVAQNSADIRELKQAVAELRDAVAELRQTVAQNSEDILRLTDAVGRLDSTVRTLRIRVDKNSGLLFERKFAERPWTFSGRMLRKARAVAPEDLEKFSAALEDGAITDDEADAVRHLDVVVIGNDPLLPPPRETLLAVETSLTVDKTDVERAAVRAEILREVGYPNVRPVAAGERATQGAAELAPLLSVNLVLEEQELVETE